MSLTPLARFFLAALTLCVATFAADSKSPTTHAALAYPEGFLQWKLIRATKLDPKSPATAQLTDAHFVYANDKAIEGLRTGKYEDGAVFVLDIFNLVKKDGVATLGERVSTSNMMRDIRAVETGGWLFGDFDLATKAPLATNVISDCFNCHTQRADHHYVFNTLKF
jgi:hypothetical protein